MTTTLLTLALLLPDAPVPAPKDTPPKGPAPRIVRVEVQSDGTPTILHTKTEMVQRQVVRTVVEGQVARQVTQTVQVPVQVTVKLSLDGEGVTVYGIDGKKIDPKDVRKMVTKPVAALVSADGKPVDAFYVRLAREGTLVLVVPMTAGGDRPLRTDFSAPDTPKPAPKPVPKPIERKPLPDRKP